MIHIECHLVGAKQSTTMCLWLCNKWVNKWVRAPRYLCRTFSGAGNTLITWISVSSLMAFHLQLGLFWSAAVKPTARLVAVAKPDIVDSRWSCYPGFINTQFTSISMDYIIWGETIFKRNWIHYFWGNCKSPWINKLLCIIHLHLWSYGCIWKWAIPSKSQIKWGKW